MIEFNCFIHEWGGSACRAVGLLLKNINKGWGLIFLVTLPLTVWAQEDNLRQVVRTVFYNPEVFNKIFIEYAGDKITFMEGYPAGMKGAFVLPDTTLQNGFPNLLDLVGTSHEAEKYFMTITFLSHPRGNVYITSNVHDMAILFYVDFENIYIKGKTANIAFHTTSFPESKGTKLNHFKIDCDLVKRGNGWKVKNLRIDPIECCTPLW